MKFRFWKREAPPSPVPAPPPIPAPRAPEAPAAQEEQWLERAERLGLLLFGMRQLLKDAPDTPYAELKQRADGFFGEHPSSPAEVAIADAALAEYAERRRYLKQLFESRASDEALYEQVFGKKPKGVVHASLNAIVLHFTCEDSEDYAPLGGTNSWGYFFLGAEGAQKLAIPGLVSRVTASKTRTLERDPGTSIIVHRAPPFPDTFMQRHEQEHAFYYLFYGVALQKLGLVERRKARLETSRAALMNAAQLQPGAAGSSPEKTEKGVQFLRNVFELRGSHGVASEILCRATDGYDLEACTDTIASYLSISVDDTIAVAQRLAGDPALITDEMKQAFTQSAGEEAGRAVLAVYRLLASGYKIDYIAALFTVAPIAEWMRLCKKAEAREKARA